jgi:hypothetical protein
MNKEALKTVDETLGRFDDEPELIELAPGEDQRDFLEKVVRSPRQPMTRRVKCAEVLMAYKYPKFGAVAIGRMDGNDFATLLEKAIARSQRGPQVRQIEHRDREGEAQDEG